MRKRDMFEGGFGRRGGRRVMVGILRFAASRGRGGHGFWHAGPGEHEGPHGHGFEQHGEHEGPHGHGFERPGGRGPGEQRGRRWAGPGGPGGPPWGGRGFGGRGWGGRGRGGPGGPGGPPWSGRGRAGRGDVRTAILALLAERPLHGYEIIQQIAERSGGAWRPSPGSVYPALQLLEDQGLIQGQHAEGKRVFALTEAGQTYVAEHGEELNAAWEAVKGTADDPVMGLRDLFEQVGGAIRQVAQAGTPAQIGAAQKLLASTRRQLYRILAEDEQEPGEAQ